MLFSHITSSRSPYLLVIPTGNTYTRISNLTKAVTVSEHIPRFIENMILVPPDALPTEQLWESFTLRHLFLRNHDIGPFRLTDYEFTNLALISTTSRTREER